MFPVEEDVFQRISWNAPNTEGNHTNYNTEPNENVYLKSLKRIGKIFKFRKTNSERNISLRSRNTTSAWEDTISNGQKVEERVRRSSI